MRKHFNLISQYLIGVLFGFGLLISGMTNPQKILNFLDLAGSWDPSLLFVMGGAVLIGLIGFYLLTQRSQAFFGGALRVPTRRHISKPLVIGSIIFGAGWGIAGFCPGPAIVSVGSGQAKAIVFVIAMLAGMWICEHFFIAHQKTA
jgi:hypothetical protein